MLLSAQMLADVADANRYRNVEQVLARAGSTIDVYFQLFDRDAGRRYIPASKSTLLVSLKSVYPRKQLAFPAVNPFPEDRSIWKFTIAPNDGKLAPAPGGGPIIDWSNLVPIGEPFDFNGAITDYGMVGTLGLVMTLTENQGYTAPVTLSGVAAGATLVINGVTFTAVAAGATGTQFDIGLDDAGTAANLATVISTNAGTCQVSASAVGATVTLVAQGVATITAVGSGGITAGSPALSPSSRVTAGWASGAISIQPSIPTV